MFAFKIMKINYKNIMKHQKLLTLLFMSLPLASHAGIVISEESFPDSKFRDFLLAQPYGTDGVITDAEIADIKNLSVPNMEIVKLQGIEYFTALTELQCSANELETLDLSNNESLTALTCANNKLKTLTLPTGPTLKYVDCSYNRLVLLDLSNHASIKNLNCSNNSIALLTLPENSALTWMDCSMNQIGKSSMESLINSLPTISSGTFRVIRPGVKGEDNVSCTVNQVSAAKDKGWRVEALMRLDWREYNGGQVDNLVSNASVTFSVNGKPQSLELPSYHIDPIVVPNNVQDFNISEVKAMTDEKVLGVTLQYRIIDLKTLSKMSTEENLSREWTSCDMRQSEDNSWTWEDVNNNILNGLHSGTRYIVDCRLKMLTESGNVYFDNEESNYQINVCPPVVRKEEINLTANGETTSAENSNLNLGTVDELKFNYLTIHTNSSDNFQQIVMKYVVLDEGMTGEAHGISVIPSVDEWQQTEFTMTEDGVWTVTPAWNVLEGLTTGHSYKLLIDLSATDNEGNELETNGGMTIAFDFNENTAIETIKADNSQTNSVIYNLAGQKVNKNYKGIVIQNGRKTIVK